MDYNKKNGCFSLFFPIFLFLGCFCMAMLPLLWDELSGENQQTMNRLSAHGRI